MKSINRIISLINWKLLWQWHSPFCFQDSKLFENFRTTTKSERGNPMFFLNLVFNSFSKLQFLPKMLKLCTLSRLGSLSLDMGHLFMILPSSMLNSPTSFKCLSEWFSVYHYYLYVEVFFIVYYEQVTSSNLVELIKAVDEDPSSWQILIRKSWIFPCCWFLRTSFSKKEKF